jgi:four helix bundle protein
MPFDHEKLQVYQEAVRFASWAEGLLESIDRKSAAASHLDRASILIPLNIAEGDGKFTATERCRFFDVARGCALEAAGCLDVLVAKRQTPAEKVQPGKELLEGIVSTLVSLIKSNADRPYETREEIFSSRQGP